MSTHKPSRVEKWSSAFFYLVIRSAVVLALFTMAYMVYKGYKDDRYIIQAFDVPRSFDENGISGKVLARKIQDEVSDFKKEHQVFKKDSIDLDANAAPDLQVALMG